MYLYGVGRVSSVDINLLVAGSLRIVSDKISQFIFNQAEVGRDGYRYIVIHRQEEDGGVVLYVSVYLFVR